VSLISIRRKRARGSGRLQKHKQFPNLVPTLDAFCRSSGSWLADPRRRSEIARLGNSKTEGFRLEDALDHLLREVPGLYKAGLSRKSVQYLFQPTRKGTEEARHYHGVVKAKVAPLKNNARVTTEEVHFVRAQQKLFQEWQMLHGQPCFSGDDMNIIQVGRPAVSRYHQIRRFFAVDQGPDFDVHDWALAELGVKLGGFMCIEPPEGLRPPQRARSKSF
jgi:hypothetical protein